MRRWGWMLILWIAVVSVSGAGVLDFKRIEAARKAYEAGQYAKSAALLEKLGKESAPLHYDLGNAYYKKGEYAKALVHYKRAKGEGVDEHDRLHNLGNTYFRQRKFKAAITAYEAALKIKEDPETRYNLEQAKKMLQKKKEQEKRQKQQQKQQKKQQKSQQKKDQQKKQKQGGGSSKQKQQGKKGSQQQKKKQQGSSGKNQKKNQQNNQGGKGQKGEKDQESRKQQGSRNDSRQGQSKPQEGQKGGRKAQNPQNSKAGPKAKKPRPQESGKKEEKGRGERKQPHYRPKEQARPQTPQKSRGGGAPSKEESDVRSLGAARPGKLPNAQAKELRRLMKRMGDRKMPTLMYQTTGGRRNPPNRQVNPW